MAAIRLHEMGWFGSYRMTWGIRGGEMHRENVRVVPVEGKLPEGVLVADFSAFFREADRSPASMKIRVWETLGLMGYPFKFERRKIYPHVLQRLQEGVENPGERRRIEAVVRQELGL